LVGNSFFCARKTIKHKNVHAMCFLSQFCVFSGFIFLLNYYYGSERSPGVQQECLNQLMMMCITHNNNIIQVDCNEKFIQKDSMVFKGTGNCSGMNTDILTTESGLKVIVFPRQSFLNFVPFSTVYAVKPHKCENLYL
jgi:hypothetical protein